MAKPKRRIWYDITSIDCDLWYVPRLHKWMKFEDVPENYGCSNRRSMDTFTKAMREFEKLPEAYMTRMYGRYVLAEWSKRPFEELKGVKNVDG